MDTNEQIINDITGLLREGYTIQFTPIKSTLGYIYANVQAEPPLTKQAAQVGYHWLTHYILTTNFSLYYGPALAAYFIHQIRTLILPLRE